MKLFVHIPKTGGISVRSALSEMGEYREWMGGHHTVAQIKAKSILNEIEYDSIFTVVRNPYHRFLSMFYHLKSRYLQHRHKFNGELASIWDFIYYSDLEQFANYFLVKSDTYNMINNFHHFLPQSSYLDCDDEVKIFHTENMQEVSQYLKTDIPHHNQSSYNYDLASSYTDKTRYLIETYYQNDFENFGYEIGNINN